MQTFVITLIVAALVQTALGGPVPTTPPLAAAEVPQTVDEMLEFFINNYYYTYDYRVEAINAEIEKLLQYITEAKTKVTGDAEKTEKYHHAELALAHFQTKINKSHNTVGINDILMLVAPGVAKQLISVGDEEFSQKCQEFAKLLSMDELQKQMEAAQKVTEFINANNESVKMEFAEKLGKWKADHFSQVSFWE